MNLVSGVLVNMQADALIIWPAAVGKYLSTQPRNACREPPSVLKMQDDICECGSMQSHAHMSNSIASVKALGIAKQGLGLMKMQNGKYKNFWVCNWPHYTHVSFSTPTQPAQHADLSTCAAGAQP